MEKIQLCLPLNHKEILQNQLPSVLSKSLQSEHLITMDVVIAVLTAPIFSQTERQNLIASVKSMVAEDLNISQDQVIVTYDMELFRAMDEVKNEDKERLLEKAIKLSGTPF